MLVTRNLTAASTGEPDSRPFLAVQRLFDELAVVQFQCPGSEFHQPFFVGCEDDGPAARVFLGQKFGDDVAVGRVQVSRGFIGQDDVRLTDERAGHCDALLFPYAEFTGTVGEPGGYAEPFGNRVDVTVGRSIPQGKGYADIVAGGQYGMR